MVLPIWTTKRQGTVACASWWVKGESSGDAPPIGGGTFYVHESPMAGWPAAGWPLAWMCVLERGVSREEKEGKIHLFRKKD